VTTRPTTSAATSAPRALGWLLAVAGVAYVVDTVAHLVLADDAAVANVFLVLVAVPSVLGEGWLGLWLLLRAGRAGSGPQRQLDGHAGRTVG